jgi:hypothetical protein
MSHRETSLETPMAATAPDLEDPDSSDGAGVAGRVDAREEDAYWERSYWREVYYRRGLDYEDYAPAYCVGYIGYAQYGGAFEDAETWLCANWIRIKGDSRLGLDEARLAMRSAWERLARRAQRVRSPFLQRCVRLLRRRLGMRSFKLGARIVR